MASLLLMNLDWFRRNDAQRKCLEFLNAHPDSFAADQCALNYVCRDHVEFLPPGWGDFTFEAVREDVSHCIHFSGMAPWDTPSRWTVFCGEHRLLLLWRDFAANIVGDGRLLELHMSRRQTFLPRLAAAVLWPILCAAAFLRAYPHALNSQMESIRRRCRARVVETSRQRLFGHGIQPGALRRRRGRQ